MFRDPSVQLETLNENVAFERLVASRRVVCQTVCFYSSPALSVRSSRAANSVSAAWRDEFQTGCQIRGSMVLTVHVQHGHRAARSNTGPVCSLLFYLVAILNLTPHSIITVIIIK